MFLYMPDQSFIHILNFLFSLVLTDYLCTEHFPSKRLQIFTCVLNCFLETSQTLLDIIFQFYTLSYWFVILNEASDFVIFVIKHLDLKSFFSFSRDDLTYFKNTIPNPILQILQQLGSIVSPDLLATENVWCIIKCSTQ